MKSWMKPVSAGALLLAMTVGVTGAAFASETATEPSAVPMAKLEAAQGQTMMVRHTVSAGLLGSPVHEQNYLRLMAKLYTPGQAGEWEAAFKDREAAEQNMPKPMRLSVAAVKAAPAQGDGAVSVTVPDADLKKDVVVFKVRNTEGDETLAVQAQPAIHIEKFGKTEAVKAELSEEFKRQVEANEQFETAVKANDEAKIRELLPAQLIAYKEQTAAIKKMAEQLQKDLPAPAEKQQ